MIRLRVNWCSLKSLALLAYLNYNFLGKDIAGDAIGLTER